MKTKLGIVILAMACGGLVIGLFATKNAADERLKKDADAILDFSNQLVAATANLDELRQVNLMLTNDLAGSRQEALTFSNQFTETSGMLADTNASLQKSGTKSPVSAAASLIWKRKIRCLPGTRPC